MRSTTAFLSLIMIAVLAAAAPLSLGDLHGAAAAGDADAVALMLRHGADADEANDAGESAIVAASKGGHVDVVRVLVAAGADLTGAIDAASGGEVKAVLMAAAAADEEANAPAYVKMETTLGEIIIELNREKAPISCANFIEYVEAGHYDGLIFHRVIPTFMIQGGGFDADMSQRAVRDPIKNEWENGLKNVRGSIAMARTRVADSATSQFFINVVDNAGLDMPRDGAAYAVFGRVISGMDTVDKIRDVQTTSRAGHQNVPRDAVTITKATMTEKPS